MLEFFKSIGVEYQGVKYLPPICSYASDNEHAPGPIRIVSLEKARSIIGVNFKYVCNESIHSVLAQGLVFDISSGAPTFENIQLAKCSFDLHTLSFEEDGISQLFDTLVKEDVKVVFESPELLSFFCFTMLHNSNIYLFNALRSLKLSMNDAKSLRNLYAFCTKYPQDTELFIKAAPKLFKKLCKEHPYEEFMHPDAKKIPYRVFRWINSYRNPVQVFFVMKAVAEREDGNSCQAIVEYVNNTKFQLGNLPSSVVEEKYDVFFRSLKELVEKGYSSRRIIGYVIRQNFYYGDFSIPHREIKKLSKYIDYHLSLGKRLDKFPSSIHKAYAYTENHASSGAICEAYNQVENCAK